MKALRKILFLPTGQFEEIEERARCAKSRVDASLKRNDDAFREAKHNRVRVRELVDELLHRVNDAI